jgi:MtrB/PioB family decaheme-associated outer membrane protein
MKTPLLIATLLTTGFAAAVVEAADEVDGAELPINQIEFGIGSVNQHGFSTVDEDLWKFGRYNGLYQQGPYFIGDINTRDINEDAEYWSVRGTNLGLESRFFRLESGTQGKTDFFFEFDQLPNYINNTGETPYLYPGSTQLLLPSGYPYNPTASDINPYLQPVEFQTERQRVGAGLDIKIKNYWSFDVGFRHETKNGTNQIGSAVVSTSATSGFIRTASGALIIEPIDYETDLVDVAFRYARDKAQFAFEYHGSTFKNANDSLYWQDFYRTDQFGSQALPPDNQMHQLSFTGGYQFSPKSNLTGVLSISSSTQNQDFQPYDVGTTAPTALPRDSLDGEVLQTNTNIKFTYRPSRNFQLNANYRYDNRDNQTGVDTWFVTVADSDEQYLANNSPLSYEHNQIDLIGNWRIGSTSNLRFGYQYDLMYREYATLTGSEDSDNKENKVFAKLRIQPSMAWNLALYGEASDRTLNNFDSPPDEDPRMVPFYVADRQREQVGALVEYLPNQAWSFGARAEYNMDDYNEAQIGLLEAESPSFTLDASYHPNKDVTTYAYYTREQAKSKQKGRATTSSSDPWPWQADVDDTMDTFGLGGKLAGLGKWDVGLDLTYNKSKGQMNITDLSSSTTSPYPDLKTELASLKLWAQYHQGKNLIYRLSYWYEDYDADNWALDGLQPTSLVGATSPAGGPTNYLLTGEDTLDYAANVIGVSLVYQFQ